ncbi:uncharacterized protein EAF02_006939 [Botrytis sinoallii]|uniref:uncharacterized protein n=1 Tax=Botrytis sinoallii TaxID=1463999 RepID=UPI0019021B04|nr:uncharacterized protein EAF02_006939 [Botrytis sinoallii]KAF7881048.1 hypothetical protein EAF02_006939 [Botrytis sinoallii]
MSTETNDDRVQPNGTMTPYQEAPGELPVTDPTEQHLFANLETTNIRDDTIHEAESVALSVSSYNGVPAALNHDMGKFLSNDQLAKVKDLLQAHLPSPICNPEVPVEGCPLLNSLSLDCRRLIWKLLLLNPLLGESFFIDGDQVFGLFPAILRVNRQIYNKGMDILYGSNKFLIGCIPYNSYFWDSCLECALARGQHLDRTGEDREVESEKSLISTARYVQHWKILISAIDFQQVATEKLLRLCHSIYMANIQSLEVLIIPKGIEDGWNMSDNYGYEHQLAITLSPLKRFRNVQQFNIRPAEIHEIPAVAFDQELADEFIPILPSPVDEVELTGLIQGNSEVETIEKMYKTLLTYAQAFERFENFKSAMDINHNEDELEQIYSFEVSSSFAISDQKINPFKASRHPVERALSAAKTSMFQDKMDQFKMNRSLLIQYLEHEYQIIEAASKNLVDFIKIHKIANGFFRHPLYINRNEDYNEIASPNYIATQALVLLEDYEARLKRKLEPATKVEIRKYKLLFNSFYDDLPRERLMKLCEMAYEKQWWLQFVTYFQEAVDDMDVQYLAIRQARKKLYAWDLQATVREVDVKPMLSDEIINWNECEPDMRINEEWRKYRSYGEPELSDHTCDEDSDANSND